MAGWITSLGDIFPFWWWRLWLDRKVGPTCTCKDKWERRPLWKLKGPWLRRFSPSATTSQSFWSCTSYTWCICMSHSWILCTYATVYLDRLLTFPVAFNASYTHKQAIEQAKNLWDLIGQGWNFAYFWLLSRALLWWYSICTEMWFIC